MLKSITFKQSFRTFRLNDKFVFEPGMNILVGDQGAGKSTIFDIIVKGKNKYADIVSIEAIPLPYYYLDFEKDNPRNKPVENEITVASHFISHGESNLNIVERLLTSTELNAPSLIMMDEADQSLSIRSCYKLIDIFLELVKRNHQLICSIHNPIIVEYFNKVLSIEHKKWMSSKEFINSHKTIRTYIITQEIIDKAIMDTGVASLQYVNWAMPIIGKELTKENISASYGLWFSQYMEVDPKDIDDWTEQELWVALIVAFDKITPERLEWCVKAEPHAALIYAYDKLTSEQFNQCITQYPWFALAYSSDKLTPEQREWYEQQVK